VIEKSPSACTKKSPPENEGGKVTRRKPNTKTQTQDNHGCSGAEQLEKLPAPQQQGMKQTESPPLLFLSGQHPQNRHRLNNGHTQKNYMQDGQVKKTGRPDGHPEKWFHVISFKNQSW